MAPTLLAHRPCLSLWTWISEVAISSCPCQIVDRAAQGTLLTASDILIFSALLTWLPNHKLWALQPRLRALEATPYRPLIHSIVPDSHPKGVVTSQVFGFELAESGSEFFLGGTNNELCTGDFTCQWVVPLANEGWSESIDLLQALIRCPLN